MRALAAAAAAPVAGGVAGVRSGNRFPFFQFRLILFSFPPPPLPCFYFSLKFLWLRGIDAIFVPTLV
jgi:hypothetical protein